ncbi:MAG: phosphatidylserine decarboxylase family protein [Bacteroidia bacterium]|nr:phosphatidylserine decarboxylase family protein [Bacteroidia bacterium]
MRIHREGYRLIIYVFLMALAVECIVVFTIPVVWIQAAAGGICLFFWLLVVQFFRNPVRKSPNGTNLVIAPADGKVVVIEQVDEKEYLKDKRIQISIFMSPLNVHVNRFPVSGKVSYVKYHPGLYLVAWHPKSSSENERTTVVVKTQAGYEVLFRQIAGAVARRIKYYCKLGDEAVQGAEMGFIKFGSRVDVLLPLSATINVKLNETVKGGETIIARI